MRRFQEPDAVRTWAGRAYTDEELSRRFESQSSGASEGLMDEETARRLVARERSPDLMDEETVKRKLAAERAAAAASPERNEEDSRASAARAACQESSGSSRSPSRSKRRRSCSRSRSRSRSKKRCDRSRSRSRDVRESLRPGAQVRLTDLKQAAALNGSRGVLERFDAASGRWEVKLLATGDVKALRPENLLLEAEPETSAGDGISSPQPDIAPRSPPPAPALTGRAGARSTGAPPPPAKPARRTGIIRWYNGRRRLGAVIPDEAVPGAPDLFIPAQGAPNGSQVPPQPGGLFHGTRVSFLPMAIKADVASGKKAEVVCMDVRPLAGQKGLTCGVDTNAGAKERNDDRLAAQDLHELGFLAGIFDGHRGGSCAEFAAKQVPPSILSAYRARAKRPLAGLQGCGRG
ncbi:unnamed protein product, partial [Effrenium voratum]